MTAGKFFAEYWSVIVSAILTIASWVWAIIEAKRTGNKKGLLNIQNLIPDICSEAEQIFGKGLGASKLQYVLTKLRIYALENNVKVDTAYLEEKVNTYVKSTKVVNAETKPTTAQTNNSVNELVSETRTNNNQVNVNI